MEKSLEEMLADFRRLSRLSARVFNALRVGDRVLVEEGRYVHVKAKGARTVTTTDGLVARVREVM